LSWPKHLTSGALYDLGSFFKVLKPPLTNTTQ
jgi:hypothetical protein